MGLLGWLQKAECSKYESSEGEPWPWDTEPLRGKAAKQLMADRVEIAKSVCSHCPVASQCLVQGISLDLNPENYAEGIWGGMTPEERAEMLGRSIKWVAGNRKMVQAS